MMVTSMSEACLYIVATPIGHLNDMTFRAVEILKQVDYIAAEDTRHSKKLMEHYAISTPMIALHDHNEAQKSNWVIEQLATGASIALISDAGTPLISDPGYVLVNQVIKAGYQVIPIPGASAVVTALSAAGLPTDAFQFVGFLPAKAAQRQQVLQQLLLQTMTVVCYESSHRLLSTLNQLTEFAPARPLVLAKELTKRHERFIRGTAPQILDILEHEAALTKGEFVLMLQGTDEVARYNSKQIDQYLMQCDQLGIGSKAAAALLADITGQKKNHLYKRLLALKDVT